MSQRNLSKYIFLVTVGFSIFLEGCEVNEKDPFLTDMNKYYGEEAKIPSHVLQKYIKPGMSLKSARDFLKARGFEVYGIGHAPRQDTPRQSIYEAKKQERYKLIFLETQRIRLYVEQGRVVKSEGDKYLDGI